jgi:hypothetical protein
LSLPKTLCRPDASRPGQREEHGSRFVWIRVHAPCFRAGGRAAESAQPSDILRASTSHLRPCATARGPNQEDNHMTSYSYARCLQNAYKVNWRIDDLLGNREFDLSRNWLPAPLTGATHISFLNEQERRRRTRTSLATLRSSSRRRSVSLRGASSPNRQAGPPLHSTAGYVSPRRSRYCALSTQHGKESYANPIRPGADRHPAHRM